MTQDLASSTVTEPVAPVEASVEAAAESAVVEQAINPDNPTNLTPADYVHLHNHTQFSLLDGLTRIPDLINYVKESGMKSVAMTDHGTLSGAIEFYKEAKDKGIKPIIGIETYVAARKHTDKDPQKDKQRFHLILMAMNETGWQNLMKLSTIANLDGYYYYPRIDHDLLEKYNEGLIVSSACMGGEVGQQLLNDDYEGAKKIAKWYKKVFGDRYYLEIQDHGHPDNPIHSPEQGKMNKYVLELGKELNIPVVVTCDAHYLKHEHQDSHEILLCIGTGAYLSDEKRMSLKDYPLHVEEPTEIIKRWGKTNPDVVRNTAAIAERVNLEIDLGGILIPKFPVPEGETEKTFLDKAVYRGLAWRYGGKTEEETVTMTIEECRAVTPEDALKRADYELSVVDGMGFNGYFLIVSDFIGWGKSQGIIFGPGRGSAAGSIMAYAIKITDLDPLRYDLLFERFLNPDRISMPDVDIDIQDTRREEVIQYCVKKYGTERVSNIVTFGRMFARNAVRDVARVMQVPYADADRLAKMIPQPVQGRHIPLPVSLKEDMDLRREYETNDVSRQVLDQAMILEGTVRSHGVHACGVIIAPDDLVKFVPLEMAQKGVVTAQFPMGQVEELGLLKMDFLGLSNLTIINNCLRIIRKVYKQEINLSTIPLDTKAAYDLLGSGDTTGVFQLESAGMKRYLKELKPTVFEDIIAMVALYRPGPMQFIDEFIARKHGTKKIIYPHDSMENSLKNTYGVLVYQEQVMQISKEVCGFTGGEADTLRKAIGKKKIDLMAKMKDKMIDGAFEKNQIPRDLMERFWKQLEDFAAYCFNKSHAACYGLIAYWTAYLKALYPSAFMAAVMTSDYDDTDRLAIEIAECQHMGIEVLPPDVNESYHEFAVVTDNADPKAPIRFGMNAIKNVGSGAVEEILRARKLDGPFEDIEDFLSRVNVRICNRKNLESLIKAGAMDRFGDRSRLLHNLDVMLAYAQRLQKERASGQTDLFGNLIDDGTENTAKPKLALEKAAVVYTPRDQLLWERELLGLYLSQHPLAMFETYLDEQSMAMDALKPEMEGRSVVVGGAINDVREITTKNGSKMAFIKLEDKHAELELILFPGAYQQTAGLWERDKVILARGKISAKDREGNLGEDVKILVDDAREITGEQATAYQATGKKMRPPGSKHSPAAAVTVSKGKAPDEGKPKGPPKPKPSGLGSKQPERVYIRLADSGDQTLLVTLKQTIDAARGQTEVVLVLGETKQIIKLPGGVSKEPQLIKQLCSLVGDENVKVQ